MSCQISSFRQSKLEGEEAVVEEAEADNMAAEVDNMGVEVDNMAAEADNMAAEAEEIRHSNRLYSTHRSLYLYHIQCCKPNIQMPYFGSKNYKKDSQ